MSSQDLVNKHKKQKFESEISTIEYRLVESLANLDMLDGELTHELYKLLSSALDEVIVVKNHINNGTQPEKPFKLPEGYREKLEPHIIDRLVEGRDYSGYIREQATYEVEDMSDEKLFEEFQEFIEYDPEFYGDEIALINRIKDIVDKEKLIEAVNE